VGNRERFSRAELLAAEDAGRVLIDRHDKPY
jgi:hypothetical protein